MKEELDLKDSRTREELFKQYTPLMYKIVNQYVASLPLCMDDIVGAAMEGFTYAMNTYKTGTSQSFKQYAGWCMRNFILSSANSEGHTVKMSAYNQKKAKEAGESTFKCLTFTNMSLYGDEEVDEDKLKMLGYSEIENQNLTSEDETMYILYEWLTENFSTRDCHVFFHTYGIFGHQLMKGNELAEMYGLSPASISVTNKKIIKKIRTQNYLMDILRDLI